MTVLAYDPYASAEKAAALGVQIVSWEEALERVREGDCECVCTC